MSDLLKSKQLWILVNSYGIGGAESRAVKVASQLSSLNLFKEVNLLVNEKLKQEYKKNKELKNILDNSKVNIMLIENFYKNSLSRKIGEIKLLINKKVFRYLNRMTFIKIYLLKWISWYSLLRKNIDKNDIIHCIFDDFARNGCFFLAQERDQKILVEITSNRLLERVFGDHIKNIFAKKKVYKNLIIRCVSETVYENSLKQLPLSFFKERGIDFHYYSGPFINIRSKLNVCEKENVLIYAHRFIQPKNPIMFSNVIKRLLDENELSGWKVKIRGTGPLCDEIVSILKPYIEKDIVDVGFSYELSEEFVTSKIFVSIIVTGNYPSNSAFEAMRNGNLLLLSDTGITKKKFNHPDIYFVDLDENKLYHKIKKVVADCTTTKFQKKSNSMRQFFNKIVEKNSYFNEILNIYHLH